MVESTLCMRGLTRWSDEDYDNNEYHYNDNKDEAGKSYRLFITVPYSVKNFIWLGVSF